MTVRHRSVGLVVAKAFAWATLSGAANPQDPRQPKDKIHEVRVKDGLTIQDKLAVGDDRDKKLKDSYCKVYLVRMTADKTYVIRMNAADQDKIDAVLRVEDKGGKELAFNDDDPNENTLNARIDFNCPKDGVYRVIATSLNDNETGDYTLLIKQAK